MLVVIDTNIFVSAFWNPSGSPAKFVWLLSTGEIRLCYDLEILNEYRQVLFRSKFKFDKTKIMYFLDSVVQDGMLVIPESVEIDFTDETDRKFYEVAKTANAKLITGNLKHYPDDGVAISPASFLNNYNV